MPRFIIRKKRLLLIIGGVLAGFVVYQQSFHLVALTPPNIHHVTKRGSLLHRNFSLLDDVNQTCHLPQLEPFDTAILEYLHIPRPFRCKWTQPSLILIKDSILQFNQSALDESGYRADSISCYYQPILRPDGDDDVIEYGPKQQITGRDVIQHEYIYVQCDSYWHFPIYTSIHAHPRELNTKPPVRETAESKPSILVFGIDSLSHMNAIRFLPKTYEYLTQNMGAHIMHGMTRIGDNTWPNTMAMLTGKRVYAEIETYPIGKHYDDYPVIWRNFSRNNKYVTFLAEDWPKFNMFNQDASGFLKIPTDHYFRPFWLAVESSFTYKKSSYMCYGPLPKHVHQLQYVRDFVAKYRDVPYFAFSLFTEIGHDIMEQVGLGDEDFANFLREVHAGGYLNNTILFFFGDHGHRMDHLILTEMGRVDSNLPLSAIVLPPSITTKFPIVDQILRKNTNRLTSMFDYYDTFVDILHYVEGKNTLGKGRQIPRPVPHRLTYSLFSEIPLNRTCLDAGIPDSYCPCNLIHVKLSRNSPLALEAADVLLRELNDIIANLSHKCATWTLSQIKSAYSVSAKLDAPTLDVRLLLEASPGKALFEALVRLKRTVTKGVSKVVDEINRVNRYKGQDSCLGSDVRLASGINLRKYCYCL